MVQKKILGALSAACLALSQDAEGVQVRKKLGLKPFQKLPGAGARWVGALIGPPVAVGVMKTKHNLKNAEANANEENASA